MKLMSDRVEIKQDELEIIEKDLKRDIESESRKESAEGNGKVKSDNSNDPLRTVEDTIKKHKVYRGEDKELQSLSTELTKFTLEKWEEGINWYEKSRYKFYGATILNSTGQFDETKFKAISRNMSLKVRIVCISRYEFNFHYYHIINNNSNSHLFILNVTVPP